MGFYEFDRPGESKPWRDTMQVCTNGHKITASYQKMPEDRKAFCQDCGARTITTCDKCNQPIPGYLWGTGVMAFTPEPVPKYCVHCGEPYPWQREAMEEFQALVDEQPTLDDEAKKYLKGDALIAISPSTPTAKTPRAVSKLRDFIGGLGHSGKEMAMELLPKIASEVIWKQISGK